MHGETVKFRSIKSSFEIWLLSLLMAQYIWTKVLKMNNIEINKLVRCTYSGNESSGNENYKHIQ